MPTNSLRQGTISAFFGGASAKPKADKPAARADTAGSGVEKGKPQIRTRDFSRADEQQDDAQAAASAHAAKRQRLHAKLGPQPAAGAGPTAGSEPAGEAGLSIEGVRGELTPLERQFVDLKKANPDTLLAVETGYKYRFFGHDAKHASRLLHIANYLDHNFYTAQIPTHRLHVHVRRLVNAGYKVGIVRQLESAALKAAGDNKRAPFTRSLTSVYTRATYVDDVDDDENEKSPSTGFIMCIHELLEPRGMPVRYGVLAVQPGTGDVVYDAFEDVSWRSELETRIMHLQPCEIVLCGKVSVQTERIMSYLQHDTRTMLGERVRIDRYPDARPELALTGVKAFYDTLPTSKTEDNFAFVKDLPESVIVCLSVMIEHLRVFGLELVFAESRFFRRFTGRQHMLVNGNTLSNLEIFTNSEGTQVGSLFWVLDHTRTKFGRRQLRSWVGQPLIDKDALDERIAIVAELASSKDLKINRFKGMLSRLPDLSKSLSRIHYGRCEPPELLKSLQAFAMISSQFSATERPTFRSAFLNETVRMLPGLAGFIHEFLGLFHHQSAAAGDKVGMFVNDGERYEGVMAEKSGIIAVEHDLTEHLDEVKKQLKQPKLSFVTVAGIEYLIEVRNADVSRLVPNTWRKISGTKFVSRFHTPQVLDLLREREQRKERLAAEADQAYRKLLKRICTQYSIMHGAVNQLGELDALFSLAIVSMRPNYCAPEFCDGQRVLEIVEGRHPMVEQTLASGYVPNDIRMSSAHERAVVLTGPNMGGKSSYVRQTALICIMAQIGSYVPAKAVKMSLLDAVFTRMGASDNIFGRESTFMVEMREAARIMRSASENSLVILDELGRGTATFDGQAIAAAVLGHFVHDVKCFTIMITHYAAYIGGYAARHPGIMGNYHMSFVEQGDGSANVEQQGSILLLYRLAKGVAHHSFGLNVARMAGLPSSVLDSAARQAAEFSRQNSARQAQLQTTALRAALRPDATSDEIDALFARLRDDMGAD